MKKLQIYNTSLLDQIPAIATIMFIDTFTSLSHNMFRPPRAIIKWSQTNIQYICPRRLLFPTDPLSLVFYNKMIYLFTIYFPACHRVEKLKVKIITY
jgi:hypothetical protein